MNLQDKNIGFAITGSFCTFSKVVEQIKKVKDEGANVIPIMSFSSFNYDTRFGNAQSIIEEIEEITGNKIIHTIQDSEPIGPKSLTDLMIVAPATGNTIAKIANGINDTPVTMAVKSHLRNNKPIIIGISTNDALSSSAQNIGKLLNRKNFYFIPFRQDNPITKPNSIVFDSDLICKTIKSTLNNVQLQPILL